MTELNSVPNHSKEYINRTTISTNYHIHFMLSRGRPQRLEGGTVELNIIITNDY